MLIGGVKMSREIAFYQENEQRVNWLYFYLLSGCVLVGAILMMAVLVYIS